MTDVATWLAGLGLAQYVEAFRANDVDDAVLPGLTGDDLKELGVASVGHRRRMLDAIAALKSGATADAPADSGERRFLTVLFADIVGSSALAARLDPEDMREIIRQYQQACAETVARFGGHLARFVGDGTLAIFGYPQAREDHAQRAVEAGLALIDAMAELALPPGIRPALRVGIASGTVVVGDIVSAAAREQDAIVGDTPNLAARLQQLAAPDQVVVAEATQRLARGRIEFAALGLQEAKGLAAPVPVYRALRESATKTPAVPLAAALVGREAELAALVACWRRAAAGQGELALVSGEAGMGKTRLAAALVAQAMAEPGAELITWECSPYYQDSPLYPVLAAWRRAAGLARGDSAAAQGQKLAAHLLPTHVPAGETLAMLASLLGLEGAEPQPAAGGRAREIALAMLLTQLEARAARAPVLLLVEDTHWADHTTLELLKALAGRLGSQRLMLLATHRGERLPAWAEALPVTGVALGRLDLEGCAALARAVLGALVARPLPAALMHDILDRTDGVPLFVEELVKMLASRGTALLATDPASNDETAVPDTLQGLLVASLDRLGPAREVAQVAAVIGRAFPRRLLEQVLGRPAAELQAALDRLAAAGLLLPRPDDAGVAWLGFRHGLLRDAAYATLLRANRRRLHARVAQTLQAEWPDIARRNPELVAHHYAEAGQAVQAWTCWRDAGRLASAKWADTEAAAHYRRALQALKQAGEGDGAAAGGEDAEFDVLVEAIRPMIAATGYHAPEVVAAIDRAAQLSSRIADPTRLFPMVFQQWIWLTSRGEIDTAHAFADRFRRSAEATGRDAERLIWLRLAGSTLMFRGECLPARQHLERFLALYRPAAHAQELRRYGTTENSVTVSCCLAAIGALEGRPDQARHWRQAAVAEARRLGHPHSIGHALAFAECFSAALQREHAHLAEQAGEMLALADAHALPFWRLIGSVFLGLARAAGSGDAPGLALMTDSLDRMLDSGARFLVPTFSTLLAHAAHAAGDRVRFAQALDSAEAGLRLGERWLEPEYWRLRALQHAAAGQSGRAALAAQRAATLAEARGARLLQLRALVTAAEHAEPSAQGVMLARLGQLAAIRELQDLPDCRDASALLERLGQGPQRAIH